MKKWFTLVESLIVLVIISIVFTVVFNMRDIWKDNRNIWQEVVNTVYKEMQLLLRDLNRNKIYITWDKQYEIAYFIMQFNDTWKSLSISNQYIYPDPDTTYLQSVETTKLIEKWEYKARNAIKWADELYFKIVKQWFTEDMALLSKNWIIETGDIIYYLKNHAEDYIIPQGIPEDEDECYNILHGCENNWRTELVISCLNATNFYRKNCPNILDFNTTTYASLNWITSDFSIVICEWENNKEQNKPVWKITINVASKNATLERCNNDKVANWIDCWEDICKKQ